MRAVVKASEDREVAQYEAMEATATAGDVVRQATVYIREIKYNAQDADEAGEDVPDGLLAVGRQSRNPSVQSERIGNRLALVEAKKEELEPYGFTDEFIARGRQLIAQLDSSGGTQKHKRLVQVPEKIRDHYYQKGLLYNGLKRINSKGHSVHAQDAVASGRYNLSLLHAASAKGSGPKKP